MNSKDDNARRQSQLLDDRTVAQRSNDDDDDDDDEANAHKHTSGNEEDDKRLRLNNSSTVELECTLQRLLEEQQQRQAHTTSITGDDESSLPRSIDIVVRWDKSGDGADKERRRVLLRDIIACVAPRLERLNLECNDDEMEDDYSDEDDDGTDGDNDQENTNHSRHPQLSSFLEGVLEGCGRLEVLRISRWKLVRADGVLLGKLLQQPQGNLDMLSIHECQVVAEFFQAVQAAVVACPEECRTLSSICLHQLTLNHATLQGAWDLCAACPNLRCLSATCMPSVGSPSASPVNHLLHSATPHLVTLNFSGSSFFSGESADALQNMFSSWSKNNSLHHLEHVNWSEAKLPPSFLVGFVHYLKATTTSTLRLRILHLNKNDKLLMEQEGADHPPELLLDFVEALASLPALEVLSLPVIGKRPGVLSHLLLSLVHKQSPLTSLSVGEVDRLKLRVLAEGTPFPPIDSSWTRVVPDLGPLLRQLWIRLATNDSQWPSLVTMLQRNRFVMYQHKEHNYVIPSGVRSNIMSINHRNKVLAEVAQRDQLKVTSSSQWVVLLQHAGNLDVFLDGTLLYVLLQKNVNQILEGLGVTTRKRGHPQQD